MRRFFCCFKGENSRQVVQNPRRVAQNPQPNEPPDPSESTDSSETIDGGDGDLDELHPFGDNEFLNYAWLNNIELPDDRYPPDSNPNDPRPLSPLRLSRFTFRWQEILEGTQNLRSTNLLGRGNFGEVYRCDFPRFDKVGAAKIQSLQNPEAHSEFVAEIRTLHTANHPNVINLLGKCVSRDHRVIVYEFMPRGSVDHHIYADTRRSGALQQEYTVLNWDKRMRIAVGVAEALIYVHEELKTIHRDVKLSNVLLDEDYVPKLTDFGLATKIVEDSDGVERQSEIEPTKGTPGCIAPETEEFGLVSSKSDVYSYGVFLLTLFTGRLAYDLERPVEAMKLADWLMPVWSREENMPLVVDVALENRFSVEGLIRLFQAARMCMDPQVLARPDMRFVEAMVRQAAAYEALEGPPVTERRSI